MAAPRELKQIFGLIQPHLRAVEEAIAAQAQAFDPAVQGYVSYACESHGKRLRPALALLAAGTTGPVRPPHVDLAVIMELIHLATLVHDDIMDGAEVRRDQPTANARWGNTITVLLGDSLFAHALSLSTQFDEAAVSRRIARAAVDVCTGEILQTQRRFDLSLSLADYFRIIELKTAALFSAAAELGAQLNGAEPAVAAALSRYGLKVGTAYQVYDDCLDIAGDEAAAGKTLGTDLQKGKLTLPLLHLLQGADPEAREQFDHAILEGDPDEHAGLRQVVRTSGALQSAAQTGQELLEDARQQLANLPPTPYRQALEAIPAQLSRMIEQFVS